MSRRKEPKDEELNSGITLRSNHEESVIWFTFICAHRLHEQARLLNDHTNWSTPWAILEVIQLDMEYSALGSLDGLTIQESNKEFRKLFGKLNRAIVSGDVSAAALRAYQLGQLVQFLLMVDSAGLSKMLKFLDRRFEGALSTKQQAEMKRKIARDAHRRFSQENSPIKLRTRIREYMAKEGVPISERTLRRYLRDED